MTWIKVAMRWLLGGFFLLAGANHFINTAFYVRIMPPYMPWHLELVYLSGVIEMALGSVILIPKYAPLAAWGLIVLIVAILPANLHMALNPQLYPEIGPAILWARLPFQAVFIAWAYWFTD